MASVNKVILVGNLGRDPEVRFTAGGKAVANFSVATSDVFTDGGGQRQERTEWHRVVVWDKQAEACGQYLQKGRQVYVEGAIRTRKYNDKDGVEKSVTEVVAQRVQFLGGAGGGGGGGGGGGMSRGAPARGGAPSGGGHDDGEPIPEDDIPF